MEMPYGVRSKCTGNFESIFAAPNTCCRESTVAMRLGRRCRGPDQVPLRGLRCVALCVGPFRAGIALQCGRNVDALCVCTARHDECVQSTMRHEAMMTLVGGQKATKTVAQTSVGRGRERESGWTGRPVATFAAQKAARLNEV